MKKHFGNERGIALLLVLWVLVLLSAIVGEFCYAMRTEVNVTRNFKDQSRAYYVALAGLNRAVAELIRNQVMPLKTNLFPDEARRTKGKAEEETTQESVDGQRWRVNVDIPAVPFGPGVFKVKIGNESGKININQASDPLLKMMMDAFDLDNQQKDVIVDSILDWRDKNDLHRLNGAENDYYRSLPKPYDCKNDDFDSVEELLLVKGVSPEIFYGGLKDMVTVFMDRNKAMGSKRIGSAFKRQSISVSSDKICINAASAKMLRALPLMTDQLVQDIMDYRKEKDFESTSELSSVVGADVFGAISPFITFEENSYYTISSLGLLPGDRIRRGIKAVVEINPTLKKGWRVVQWHDGIKPQLERPSGPN